MRKNGVPVRTNSELNFLSPLNCSNNYVPILYVNNPFISLGNQIKTRYLNQNASKSLLGCITCSYQDIIQDYNPSYITKRGKHNEEYQFK